MRIVLIVALGLGLAQSASARNTFHEIDVKSATEGRLGRERLLDVPFYMAGEKHPRVATDLGVVKTNRATNAFNKSDEEACRVAFLSALISLQERARAQGGGAIIGIKSVTKGRDLESATRFRCVAGAFAANVTLTGRIVQLEK